MVIAAVGRQREGRAAQLGRIDAEQQMMHDRIADEGDLEDVARADAGFLGDAGRPACSIASRTALVISASPPGFIIT